MGNDHNEVGDAGDKGLLLAFSSGNLEDGGDDEDIGDEDQAHGNWDHRYTDNKIDVLIDSGINTGEFYDRESVTKEMTNHPVMKGLSKYGYWTAAMAKPMLQSPLISWMHTLLLMVSMYLKGLQMATWQSYPFPMSRKQLLMAKVRKKNI